MIDLLGLPGKPSETRVVVAMSGGVDSSVTAALLREQGYDVVGITLQLYDHGAAVRRAGACCAGQDIHDARRVAARIGVPHYVLDYESRFREAVIDDFAASYLEGETPIPCVRCNQTVKFRDLIAPDAGDRGLAFEVAGETPIPCVRCNQTVKFRDLLATARDLGAKALATGHYVRRVQGPAGPELHRAADPDRDQSYFLFATTAEQIEFLRFPLGTRRKAEIRALAARFDLPVAAKPDSQDICFVPQGRYADVIRRLRPDAARPGDIVDLTGRVLGRHDGIVNFTIGQRRGLGLGSRTETEPLFVVALQPAAARVVVGPKAALAKDRIRVRELNWLDARPLGAEGRAVAVKIRSTTAPVAALIRAAANSGAVVDLAVPEAGVSAGQACVVYDGSRLLGGGWIAAAERSAAARAA